MYEALSHDPTHWDPEVRLIGFFSSIEEFKQALCKKYEKIPNVKVIFKDTEDGVRADFTRDNGDKISGSFNILRPLKSGWINPTYYGIYL